MGKRILIAAPVRQNEYVFKEYLNSLNHLEIPEGYEVKKFFYLHNCSNLISFLNSDEYEIITDNSIFFDEKKQIKIWNSDNFKKIAQLRTNILKKAREEKYDFLFTVDSDTLLHPKTLIKLLNDNKTLVSNMLWHKIKNEILAICGKDEEWGAYSNQELEILKKPGLYQVGWIGSGCSLISSKAFNNEKLSYFPVEGVDNTGAEDYAFCLRFKCLFPDEAIWIDTYLPCRHLYNIKDYNRWMEEKNKYEQSYYC